jgi:hypothetical protein
MAKTDFCCDLMRHAVEDPDIPITHTAKFNEFGVKILDGGSSTILLKNCPWCGDKLPLSLRGAWFAELERLGIDPLGNDIPEEFADERWYRK